tara:strand:+ start:716 stop:907 length:192 start_codon:yes stop_codon:yes gene_type:complete
MDSIKEIDLGSTLLSIFIGLGFVGLIIIIIRTLIISLNYVLSRLKNDKKAASPGNQGKEKKGF